MPSPSSAPRQGATHDPLGVLRHDMVVWAEPVIADRIWEAYRDREVGAAFRTLIAIQHRRMWRALILQKPALAGQIRGELLVDLARAGLPAHLVEEIDNDVMEELMDIVFARFRSSRDVEGLQPRPSRGRFGHRGVAPARGLTLDVRGFSALDTREG